MALSRPPPSVPPILDALDGRRVAPGPAGSPARGRRDVLPTGRNLFSADPRTLPTPTAFDLGRRAAAEIIRDHLQQHGEMPRSLVLDLWGSASLRTGGEEVAQGLALLGCRPLWDAATGRVTGIEVLPQAVLEFSRVDVTWRISGLFRDLFPAQIALLDAAVQAVAARAESEDEIRSSPRHAPGRRCCGCSAQRRERTGRASRDCSGPAPIAKRSAKPIFRALRTPMAAATPSRSGARRVCRPCRRCRPSGACR